MKINLKNIPGFLAVAVFGLIITACVPTGMTGEKRSPKIRNIIFMIGDGMGVASLYAGMSVSDHPLNIERCPVTGLQKTFSADNYITDSAGAGTALATGTKTKNGVIGLDAEGKPVKSILEIAKEHGLSTGLVVVTSVTDATPGIIRCS